MNQEEADQVIDRMVTLGILSNYGKLYNVSDKFKMKMAENMDKDPSLDLEHAQVLTLFDFADLLNDIEIHNFNCIINIWVRK